MNLAELRAHLNAIEAERRGIHEAAGDAALTDDQQARWDKLDEDEKSTREQIVEAEAAETRARDAEQRAARVAESRQRWQSTQFGDKVEAFDGGDVRSMPRGEVRDKALKALESRELTEHLDDQQKAHVARLLRTHSGNFDGSRLARTLLATENPHYRAFFQKYLSRGVATILSAEEGRAVEVVQELRTAMSLSDSAGGYGVPVLIDPTIILTAQGHPNDFFEISRVEQITNDEWKGVSSAGATWYWTTEATAVTDGAPTLAQPTVTTKKVTGYIPYSFEVGGDYPNFASEMSTVLREGYSEKIVEGLTNGLGTTAQPVGIVTALEAASASEVGVTTDGELNPEDLYAMWDALPIRYRNNARWMSSTSVMNAVRQFASTAADANFTVNLLAANVPMLFGRPWHLNDYMDDAVGTGGVTSASDVSLLIVGDWRNFLIAQRVGMTVETVQHVINTTTGTPTGQRALLAWARLGSDSINDNAFRILTQD